MRRVSAWVNGVLVGAFGLALASGAAARRPQDEPPG